MEQCEREGYGQRLDAQRKEGCRIEGAIRVNKVVGNFHIAPGKSFSSGNMHIHDLDNYNSPPVPKMHTFTHHVHHLRFGPQLPPDLSDRLNKHGMRWTNHINPLDHTEQTTDDPLYNFMYFIKVVPTSYIPLHRDASASIFGHHAHLPHELIGLGAYGHVDGSVETHQYSVTSHKRSLAGGDDSSEGHKERMHARGGVPGVFFSYVRNHLSTSLFLQAFYKLSAIQFNSFSLTDKKFKRRISRP